MAEISANVCAFCGQKAGKELGDLQNTKDKRILAHYNCLIFSPKVTIGSSQDSQDSTTNFNIRSVQEEIQRGKKLKCSHCKKKGATIGCDEDRCRKTYHYPCVTEAKGVLVEDLEEEKYIAYCFKHSGANQHTQRDQVASDSSETSVSSETSESSVGSQQSNDTMPKRKRKMKSNASSTLRKKLRFEETSVPGTGRNDKRHYDSEDDQSLSQTDEDTEEPGPSRKYRRHTRPIVSESDNSLEVELPVFEGSFITNAVIEKDPTDTNTSGTSPGELNDEQAGTNDGSDGSYDIGAVSESSALVQTRQDIHNSKRVDSAYGKDKIASTSTVHNSISKNKRPIVLLEPLRFDRTNKSSDKEQPMTSLNINNILSDQHVKKCKHFQSISRTSGERSTRALRPLMQTVDSHLAEDQTANGLRTHSQSEDSATSPGTRDARKRLRAANTQKRYNTSTSVDTEDIQRSDGGAEREDMNKEARGSEREDMNEEARGVAICMPHSSRTCCHRNEAYLLKLHESQHQIVNTIESGINEFRNFAQQFQNLFKNFLDICQSLNQNINNLTNQQNAPLDVHHRQDATPDPVPPSQLNSQERANADQNVDMNRGTSSSENPRNIRDVLRKPHSLLAEKKK